MKKGGSLIRQAFTTETVAGWAIQVYVPPSYEEALDRRYPVVYLQDGEYLALFCLNLLEHRFRTGELAEVIIVGVAPADRNRDYTPWPAKAMRADRPDFGGGGAAYLATLTGLIKPYVDNRYRTLPGPQHTALIGASLGGLNALFAGYWHPGCFGRIGALSPSLWYEGALDFIRREARPAATPKVYLSYGTLEGSSKTNRQAAMVDNNRTACAIMRDKGWTEETLRETAVEGATHDRVFFIQQLPLALDWLFGNDS